MCVAGDTQPLGGQIVSQMETLLAPKLNHFWPPNEITFGVPNCVTFWSPNRTGPDLATFEVPDVPLQGIHNLLEPPVVGNTQPHELPLRGIHNLWRQNYEI